MLNKLITRPIAVTMTLIAIIVLGIVALKHIPVSLMPKIDIPQITVQVPAAGYSARDLDAAIIKPFRNQLMQTPGLKQIRTESKDDMGIITMEFDYSSNIDMLFVEVNEKLDRAMNYIPRGVERPKVIKASAGNIPAFYINVSLKDKGYDVNDFVNMSTYVSQILVKRLEQISSVAMVDISGVIFPEYAVKINSEKIKAAGLRAEDIYNAIKGADVQLGNLVIKDGEYQYNIRVESTVNTLEDIESIRLNVSGRVYKLSDFAESKQQPQNRKNMVVSNGNDAVVMAVIKQSDSKMSDLEKDINSTLNSLRWENPTMNFEVTRDQTKLLSYSINNLISSIIVAAILACLVIFVFMGDIKSPLLVTITIPISLIVSFLLFHLLNISINIISLSGLILGIGMMVDNSIIVIDNITQMRSRCLNLSQSVVKGTNEVFGPMLSSALTTCSVFIPLIFLSGIAGALFYDQAMAVTIGLLSSLLVSTLIIPVYYKLFYTKQKEGVIKRENLLFDKIISTYERALKWIFRRRYIAWLILILSVGGLWVVYEVIDNEKLPALSHDDTILYVDWNEMISVSENAGRCDSVIGSLETFVEQSTVMSGVQNFILSHTQELSPTEALLYLKTSSSDELAMIESEISDYMISNYPEAKFGFSTPGNVFDMIFSDTEPALVARVQTSNGIVVKPDRLSKLISNINNSVPETPIEPVLYKEYIEFVINQDAMILYGIGLNEIAETLKNVLEQNTILLINRGTVQIPVVGSESSGINGDILQHVIINREGVEIPLYDLLSERRNRDLKSIISGAEGDYYPLNFNIPSSEVESTMSTIKSICKSDNEFKVSFSGSYFSNKEMIAEMVVVIVIALLLLYFILAAQFESLVQPMIILSEVVIDIFGAIAVMWICGVSLNIMSLIGIVVMCGIIINDSILKVDTINRLRKQGYGLKRSIIMAGSRRLKPIIMTSLTTILALIPFLYRGNMGADLQYPLSVALIGGMFIGTLVSVFFIPIFYYEIYKLSE